MGSKTYATCYLYAYYLLVERFFWFQHYAVENCISQKIDLLQLQEATLAFIQRYADELAAIEETHKKLNSRSKASRQDQIKQILKTEMDEFQNGAFCVPDLTFVKNLTSLVNWNGDYESTSGIKTIYLKKIK